MKNSYALAFGLLTGVVVTALLYTFVFNPSDDLISTEQAGAD